MSSRCAPFRYSSGTHRLARPLAEPPRAGLADWLSGGGRRRSRDSEACGRLNLPKPGARTPRMTRARLTWVIASGVIAVLIAGTVDAIRSSEPSASPPSRETATERSAGKTTLAAVTTPESLPRCTVQNLALSIDVLGGTATIVVGHVWGSPCHLAPLPVRLSLTNRFGGRVRLATVGGGPDVQSRVGGDFSPGFERLIDIPYLAHPPLANCNSRGPFTAFVIVGPYSAQRKLSGSEVGC
jgi:hypothetical protein